VGICNSGGFGKFYADQVTEIEKLLEKYVQESERNLSVDKYLDYCEQLGIQPDPAKMPLELSIFPEEVQVAFFVFSLLPDSWDTNVGHYFGKDWTTIEFLFDTYNVQHRQEILYYMKVYERILVSYRAEEAAKKRKAEERKSAAKSGKQYAHNIKG
jgi:hypothetical protein